MYTRIKYINFNGIFRFGTTVAAPVIKSNPRKTPTLNRPLICCKRIQFNLYVPAPEKSRGDIKAEMLKVDDFLSGANIRLNDRLLENLKSGMKINSFTSIQTKSLPKVYESQHLLIAAETGCGKTLAFMLPIVQRIIEHKQTLQIRQNGRRLNTPLVVIIAPGRELAAQIGNVAENLCHQTDLKVKTIFGGNTKRLMVDPEFCDVDILVATIGALSKLVTTGIYRMEEVRHVVLDEADTLLDDSFSDKLSYFLRRFPFHKNRNQDANNVGTQLVLVSATMPTNTNEILHKLIDMQTLQEVSSLNLHKLLPHIEQRFLRMSKQSRPTNLLSIVRKGIGKKQPLIVFSNKSATSDFVDIFLNNNGIRSVNLNGDMLMKIRVGRFEQFQNGEFDVLSTTDVGSRGLDTTNARHVINFDFPIHISDYIHRCGRIGRVRNLQPSLVTNFVSSRREVEVVQRIEHAARTGGLLLNVNANIKNIINKQILKDMQAAGMQIPQEEAF
ncbi:PREDICTED: probable ATP-dependent RNA helicase DDX28 isoform X3 [Rhagoletis zephyria]|uniref:probable ATP-dependent RNA helicase DDX28 isoform X3 n=1 Tax=Rhagoletis zephyria TaxID=28612 RepID=UPI0008117CF3|nr:PREDICTED: probable ATP-dependent RNA helicase DDX28 isoform X3 [Rhagoletis zephyria]XP_036343744.1 probable ATP-dependent RNA helicase DDX28 isoform X3 [Rhagoletis pomonella]